MGVLDYINEAKNKFAQKREEIHQKREIAAEVRYEQQKEELSDLKAQSHSLKRRKEIALAVAKEKAIIAANSPPSGMQKLQAGLEKLSNNIPRKNPVQEVKKGKSKGKPIHYDNNIFGGNNPFG
jgi:hypothetical protein